jgi:DNA polymerase-4
VILHFDIDAFYASVAQLDDPALRGKPLAVAGSGRRAVLLTASYEARPFGVHSALPLYRALELCPQLIVVPPNFTRYRELSAAVFAIFARDALAVEGLSFDEAFVDVGPRPLEEAIACAEAVRACVRAEAGLTVSAGVAAQKMVAKIASDSAKPDGLAAVAPGEEAAYLAPLPVGRLWGIGPKTQMRLRSEGIETIGALATLDDDRLFRILGRSGVALRDLARGRDDRPVVAERETRSVSVEETFEYDERDERRLREHVRAAAREVAERLRAHGLRGATIGIKLKRGDFSTIVRQTTIAEPSDDAAAIAAAALHCFERADLRGAPVRLVGVRVATLTERPTEQLSFFSGE